MQSSISQPGGTGAGRGPDRSPGGSCPGDRRRRAWDGIVSMPLPGRLSKPRQTGLTMVIDKGLSLAQTRALLEVGADYIDFIKLAFGTTVFFSMEDLRAKVRLARVYGVDVFPGGTLLEIAMLQDRLEAFVRRAAELEFRCLEVSDGTVSVSPRYRERLVRELVRMGFRVFTEVGKKHP
ncbi:MAG TPA: phosphosulfolactate synthase, partial [Bacillota bacterium]